MVAITIFVEGPADQKFIQDFVEFHFDQKLNIGLDIKSFDGKDQWEKTRGDFEKSTDSGKLNLLIFDADNDPKARRKEIENKREALDIEFELFLFPNNNDKGELETLLLSITSNLSDPIFQCFEDYKNCIHQINEEYSKPDLKTKVYAYSEILTEIGNERKRDYKDDRVWNLNAKVLNPLLDFLSKHFDHEA